MQSSPPPSEPSSSSPRPESQQCSFDEWLGDRRNSNDHIRRNSNDRIRRNSNDRIRRNYRRRSDDRERSGSFRMLREHSDDYSGSFRTRGSDDYYASDHRDNNNTCIACREDFTPEEMFKCESCQRGFCIPCIPKYVISTTFRAFIQCTICDKPLDPFKCLQLLDPDHAGAKLLLRRSYEYVFHPNLRFCANPRCSSPFDWCPAPVSNCSPAESGKVKCPLCHTETCANCKVEWHAGRTCEQQGAGLEGANGQVLQLARTHGWRQCPRCGEMIQRNGGCFQMLCLCGCNFCYRCGEEDDPCPCAPVARPRRRRGRRLIGTLNCFCCSVFCFFGNRTGYFQHGGSENSETMSRDGGSVTRSVTRSSLSRRMSERTAPSESA